MNNKCLIFFLFLIACEADEGSLTTAPPGPDIDLSGATLVKQGMFVGINHVAMGTVSIFQHDGKYVLVLDPYSSQNGPDLKVYLSKDEAASEYIRVGNLQATMGKQSYAVPGSPALDDYSFVHVWCEKYDVEFARAKLQ
ncbi:MAG TPA: DM13 domain-containing protein [Chryseosolibacter sp.]|nr:DM13 domain-containing protein [Chryseosolibacter sp.]